MKVFKVSPFGAELALPVALRGEERFAFFHGENTLFWPYCLRLSKRDFPVGKEHDWENANFILMRGDPPQRDGIGNSVRVLKSGELDGKCVVFLKVRSSRNEPGMLHSWNKKVSFLGKALEFTSKRSATRAEATVEHPVLACAPGAEFAWEQSGGGCFRENRGHVARWNGREFSVTPEIPMVPHYARRHLETRGWLRL